VRQIRVCGLVVLAVLAACTNETTATLDARRCGDSDAKIGRSRRTITADGVKRTYELVVPETSDGTQAYPLVFVFHGDGGSGADIRASFPLEAEAGGRAVFVYPDGENATWQIDDADGLRHDLAFIDAVAAELTTHCSDERVFAVGFSRGAYFANMVACLAQTPFRAVVAHSGGGPFGVEGSGTEFDAKGNLICPGAPVAAMQIVGANDDLLDDAKKARDYWQRVAACGATTTPVEEGACASFDGCADETPEIYCEIPGLGHSIWPNAAKVTWTFLESR
jgi:polyhydroxybutyrate depolymerase